MLKDAWFRGRIRLGTSPAHVGWLTKVKRVYPERAIRSDHDVCIEGFPRSGNTFALMAFERWNPGAQIAHHLHLPGQLIGALRYGVPAILLVREPEEAVASLLVFTRWTLSPTAALSGYLSFHRALLPVVDRLAICSFEDLVQEPQLMVERARERFGAPFSSSQLDEPGRTSILADIARFHRHRFRDQATYSIPDRSRGEAKRAAREAVARHRKLPDCQEIHDRILAAR